MADFDPEAAKRDAKKMTVPQLKDRLSAAAADASGRKADLVARWVVTAHALAVAKETNRITGEQVFTVSAAIGWRALAGYVDWDTKTALTASCSEGRDAGRALDAAPEWSDNTLPVVTKRDPWRDDEYRTRDPARLRGRDAVLYATLEQALRAFCGPQPGDDDFDSDDDHDERHAMPQIRIEFISIRDYRAPREGEAPKFHIGEVHDGEWWERRGAPCVPRTVNGTGHIVNRDGLAELLRRSDPTRTSLYTGNEGFTAGYIYKSAVITLGAHVSDY